MQNAFHDWLFLKIVKAEGLEGSLLLLHREQDCAVVGHRQQ